jgi:6-phosphogluconolactonase
VRLVTYPDRELMMIGVADRLASDLRSALDHREAVSFAVPGGTTPGPVFDTLSALRLDWERVHVLPTDERWVEEDDARSNARLIRQRLLTGPAAAATLLPLYRSGRAPEDCIAEVGAEIAPRLPLDVVLLGMGADMHTASLFPGAPGLERALASDAPPVAVLHPPTQPEARITLTAPVLAGAVSTHVLITGADKRDALERARTLPAAEAPVHAVLTGAVVHWSE